MAMSNSNGRCGVRWLAGVVVLGLVVPCVAADQQPGPNYQHLRPMEWMIGTWLYRGTTADGKTLVVRKHFEWTLDRNFVTCVSTFHVNQQLALARRHMIGWNSLQKRVDSFVFGSDAKFHHGEWEEAADNRYVGKMTGLTADAKRITGTVTFTRISADEFRYQVELAEGGVPQPPIDWKFRRAPDGN